MSNPLANAEALRADWVGGWPNHPGDAAMLSALPDDRLNGALDAAFRNFEYRYMVLVDQLLARATRLVLDQFSTCVECGNLIDQTNTSEISANHGPACSLHPSNTVST